MAQWTSNNLACVNVWTTLYIMKQFKKTFKKAGALTMKELLFYNPTLTKEELLFEAEGMADFLDMVFKNTGGAKYEEGVTRAKAVADMTGLLVEPEKTLADLAEKVDEDYNF